MATKKEQVDKKVEPMKFEKEQILSSKKYSNRKDIINVLLEDGEQYSIEEVAKLISDYSKRKVK